MKNTILIVADDAEHRRQLLEIFGKRWDVCSMNSPQAALARLAEDPSPFCALLLGTDMQGMNGLEFLAVYNERGYTATIPAFLITHNTDPDVAQRAYELGVLDVVARSEVPFIVRRRVENVIELFLGRKQAAEVASRQKLELDAQAKRINDFHRGLIETLSAAIEFRDGETSEHVLRIRDVTHFLLTHTPMGEGYDKETIDQIALAAIMHDVGKIGIPDAILTKPGRLDAEEFELIRTHTTIGAKMLDSISEIRKSPIHEFARDIALHHHERWDGRGYPEGLKGDEISIPAQVVGLADAYDALLSERSYKPAYSRERAVAMISRGECGVFNPKLLDAFLKVEDALHRIIYRSGTSEPALAAP